MDQPILHHDQFPPSFSPLKHIEQALGYGTSAWSKIQSASPSDRSHILTLIYLIEAHTEALFDLCMLQEQLYNLPCHIINRLSEFYSNSGKLLRSSKRGASLNDAIPNTNAPCLTSFLTKNYYEGLLDTLIDEEDFSHYPRDTMKIVIDQSQDQKGKSQEQQRPIRAATLPQSQDQKEKSQEQQRPIRAATFPEDLGISAVSSFMHRQQQDVEMEEIDGKEEEQANASIPPSVTTIVTQEQPSIRYRLNLLRHKFATPTDLTTLQLFKAFANAAKKTNKTLILLPVDSQKQSLSPLTSHKHIDSLTANQMRLYFTSFHRDQHHSISGFIHVITSLTIEQMESKLPMAEWLQTYQYSIILCKSQDEEMSFVGALCYGSLFLHRDGLLEGITSHPAWVELNKGREKTIVIDLVVKPFKSPGRSVDMIFVRAERSKKELVQNFLLTLYDGTPKKYPRGDMLFFIPIASKLENDYTDEQRAKYVFNHTTYVGEEDCMAILGLANLSNEVKLKDRSIITIRTLLKCLPASPGMTRNRLFQVVDTNPSLNCVLVTFQKHDKAFIEDRKFDFEQELLSHLAPGQADKVFIDEFDGVHFVPVYHKYKGKIIRVHHPTKTHQEFVRHADNIMSSPPKKRAHSTGSPPQQPITPLQSLPINNITYSGAVQAHTTRTRSVVQPDGTRTTTTTQMSQTVVASMETRFAVIEKEQAYMKQRITGVESKTTSISDNIQAMMEFWKITPTTYKRKPEIDLNDTGNEEEENMEYANHSDSLVQGQGDKCF